MAVFKLRDQLFEGRVAWVLIPRIAVAGLLTRKDPVQVRHLLVEEAGRRVDRRSDRDMRTGLFPVACMYGLGVNVHDDFLFQRTPPFVSSSTMPSASNCSRI